MEEEKMITIVLAILAIAFLVAIGVAVRTLIKNASLSESVRRLQEQADTKDEQVPSILGLDKEVGSLRSRLEEAQAKEDARDKKVETVLGSVTANQKEVAGRMDDLVGRWKNPKRRGQLGEGWLIAALKRMGLSQDVHFKVQRRVELPNGREGVIDVCLSLPDGEEIAIDDKFPWARFAMSLVDETAEEARKVALQSLRNALRSHIKDVGARKYDQASDVKIRHVLVVVPDWQTLELVKAEDPDIAAFANERGVSLFPQDALYELAHALSVVHRDQGWGEKVSEIFTPDQADRMFTACVDFLDKLGVAFKRYNSLGEALQAMRKALSPNGTLSRDVIEPAANAAEKAVPEATDAELQELDVERISKRSEKLSERRRLSDREDRDAA